MSRIMSAATFISPEKSIQCTMIRTTPNPELIRRNMQEVLDSVQKIHKQRQKHRKKKRNDSVKDSPSSTQQNENLKSPLKEITKNKSKNIEVQTPTKQNSILNHFPVARKSTGDGENSADTPPTEEGKPRKSNAFEIMMSARNKSIGGGTPGKSPTAGDAAEDNPEKTKIAKRKLLMLEWNEKKGGKKRKLEEDKRDDYITQQMDKRAKR